MSLLSDLLTTTNSASSSWSLASLSRKSGKTKDGALDDLHEVLEADDDDESASTSPSSSSDDESEEDEESTQEESDDGDEDDDDDDEDNGTYYSNASTLTSMSSLAVIPKGPLGPNVPAQFHVMHDTKGKSDDDSCSQNSNIKKNPYLPPHLAKNKLTAPTSPRRIPVRARRSPMARPAVLVRRKLLRPTIGSSNNDSSWWEMPLDSLLGYPSAMPNTRVWDPLYLDEDDECFQSRPPKDEQSI